MDEDTLSAVIALLIIFLVSGVICVFFLFQCTETILWHARVLLSAMVLVSGAMSFSSLIIALREVRHRHPRPVTRSLRKM